MDTSFSSVSLVINELCQNYEKKCQILEESISSLETLLAPMKTSVCEEFPNTTSLKPPRRSLELKLDARPASKPLSQRNSLEFTHSSPLNVPSSSRTSEERTQKSGFSKLDEILQAGINQDVLECARSVEDYLEVRETTDKTVELEKQKLLLDIEKMWEQENETFQVFEPDLAEELFMQLSALEEKKESPEIVTPKFSKNIFNGATAEELEETLAKAQAKINSALLQDLDAINFDQLTGEDKKSSVVSIYKTILALRNIKKPQNGIVFKREAWLDLETSD